MASKRAFRLKPVRENVGVGSSQSRNFDECQFVRADAVDKFNMLIGRQFVSEEKFSINTHGPYKKPMHIFLRKKWDVLIDPVDKISYDLVREFYANALPDEGDQFVFQTMVRGKALYFDRNNINNFLGNPLYMSLHEVDELNKELGKLRDRGAIARTILQEGRSVELNAAGIPFQYNREDMTPEAQAVLLLVLHNIKPKLHRSSIPVDMALLVQFILEDMKVDVAGIISIEIWQFVDSTKTKEVHSRAPLPFPCLIIGMCLEKRILMPEEINEKVRGMINDDYLSRYCLEKLAMKRKKKTVGESSSTQEGFDGLDYSAWDPRMKEKCNYTWDMLEAHRRSGSFLHNSMAKLFLHQSNPQEPVTFPSQAEYNALCTWPEDRRPFFLEGAAHSKVHEGDEGNNDGGDDMDF